jgi:hypothetical protein
MMAFEAWASPPSCCYLPTCTHRLAHAHACRFRGGRGEAATYDAPDEEDEQVARDARRQAERRAGNADSSDDDDDAGAGAAGPASPPAAAAAAPATPKGRKGGAAPAPAAASAASFAPGLPSDGVDAAAHTCSLVLVLPLSYPKLLMLEIVERVAAATLVRATPGIDKVYVLDTAAGGQDGPRVQTDGVNFEGARGRARACARDVMLLGRRCCACARACVCWWWWGEHGRAVAALASKSLVCLEHDRWLLGMGGVPGVLVDGLQAWLVCKPGSTCSSPVPCIASVMPHKSHDVVRGMVH